MLKFLFQKKYNYLDIAKLTDYVIQLFDNYFPSIPETINTNQLDYMFFFVNDI